ncbi:30S ribosomal protein S17 [Desulforegula conservatrix]|uniref:30S ribosomal protein S17 n=1 Tax=Desulforegula conservatrix TaxID=153026 RepID=UPI0003F6973C|nr:30S ribosomal protein S17 [Desulforegula conservatrix]
MKERGMKRQLLGTVVSDKMEKSVVVLVERTVKHPLYKKFVKRYKRFAAHDEQNSCQVGDKVVIIESRPLSKTKRWRVSQIVEKAA